MRVDDSLWFMYIDLGVLLWSDSLLSPVIPWAQDGAGAHQYAHRLLLGQRIDVPEELLEELPFFKDLQFRDLPSGDFSLGYRIVCVLHLPPGHSPQCQEHRGTMSDIAPDSLHRQIEGGRILCIATRHVSISVCRNRFHEWLTGCFVVPWLEEQLQFVFVFFLECFCLLDLTKGYNTKGPSSIIIHTYCI